MWVIILSQRYLFVKIKALTKAINYKSFALVALAMQKKKKKISKKQKIRSIYLEGWQVSATQKGKQREKFTFLLSHSQ